MDNIFKTATTVLLMISFLLITAGCISASIDSAAAEQYTEDAATMIENYNFNDSVIAACISNASDKGYVMSVQKMDANGDGICDMAEIITKYDFQIFRTGTSEKHIVRVYAR